MGGLGSMAYMKILPIIIVGIISAVIGVAAGIAYSPTQSQLTALISDNDELLFFDSVYIQEIANNPALGTSSGAYQNAINDPSGDNFHYFRGTDFDNNETEILERYKNFN